jgi:hypothetical protein
MPLYSPPKAIVDELRSYDPMLRVRWSDHKSRWYLERKMTRGKFDFNAADPDTKIQVRDGYITVCTLPYSYLDGRVLKMLKMTDLWAQGGAKTVNQKLDDYYEQKYLRDDLNQRADLKYIANEMFNYAQRRAGLRLNFFDNPLRPGHINTRG